MRHRESRRAFLVVALCLLAAGCSSLQRRADRAYERESYVEALGLYDEAIEAGNRDPGLYYNAARASLKTGDFAGAERYYSRSLDLGAGDDVAWELANFYVSTSNYVSAARVYRYLLARVGDKQPVYNNLGTALMYAGLPFDAESYLMVAQHMDPSNPSAYLNLGLLYDRHLRQPWLAASFYECYEELAGRAENVPMVRQRASELRDRYYRLYQKGAVSCGVEYHPGSNSAPPPPVSEIKAALADEPVDLDIEGSPHDGPVSIERQIEEVPAGVVAARAAYQEKRWGDVVKEYGALPLSQLAPEDYANLGVAFREQKNFAMATHWLELARSNEQTPKIVEDLFVTYTQAAQPNNIQHLCDHVRNDASFQDVVTAYCASNEED